MHLSVNFRLPLSLHRSIRKRRYPTNDKQYKHYASEQHLLRPASNFYIVNITNADPFVLYKGR